MRAKCRTEGDSRFPMALEHLLQGSLELFGAVRVGCRDDLGDNFRARGMDLFYQICDTVDRIAEGAFLGLVVLFTVFFADFDHRFYAQQ